MSTSKRLRIAVVSQYFPVAHAVADSKDSLSNVTPKKLDAGTNFVKPLVGGAERQMITLAPFLRELGIDLMVYCRHRDRFLSNEDIVSGMPIHRIASPSPQPFGSVLFTANTVRSLIKAKPDIVHSLGLFSTANIAAINKLMLGTPIVVKLMRSGEEFGDIGRLKRKKLGIKRLNYFRKNVDAFIAISKDLTAELSEINISSTKHHFIPNGVDTSQFFPLDSPEEKLILRKKIGLPLHDAIVIYSGRLVPPKRIERLLNIWPLIKQKFKNVSLVIIGGGPSAPSLQKLATDGVRFCGPVSNVSHYLQAADIFVSPSSAEGLSNSLLEAMASGLPVVATAVGGTTDVITNGHEGFLVNPENPSCLKGRLTMLLSNSQNLQKFGSNSRSKILKDYSISSTTQKLKNLYHKLHFENNTIQ